MFLEACVNVGSVSARTLNSTMYRLIIENPPVAEDSTHKWERGKVGSGAFDAVGERTLEYLGLPVLAAPFWGRPQSLPRAPTRKQQARKISQLPGSRQRAPGSYLMEASVCTRSSAPEESSTGLRPEM